MESRIQAACAARGITCAVVLALGLPGCSTTSEGSEPNEHASAGAAAPNEEHPEVVEVRRRIVIMRTAVETLVAADRHDAAENVEYAILAREMAIDRRTDAEALEVRARAPDREHLAEFLAVAAQLQQDRGGVEEARALAELSELYLQQWRRRQAAGGAGASELAGAEGLGDLNRRLEILRLARDALDEAHQPEWARQVERAIEVGELQQAGADEEAVQAAFDALDMGMLIELLQKASGHYREWGHPDRADLCNALAELYARREREGREQD